MIKPIKIYYVTSTNETTIIYEEVINRKTQEKIKKIKGKVFEDKHKPTVYNVLEVLKKN